MECLARRKLADYLVVPFFLFSPSFLPTGTYSVCHDMPGARRALLLRASLTSLGGGGDMYCAHSLFSGSFRLFMPTFCVHTVRMVVAVRCFCAFHAVRMGVFCGWFECTYSHCALYVVVIRLYMGGFCG